MSVKNPGRNASYVDYDVGNTVDEPQETPESEGLFTVRERGSDPAIVLEPVVNGVNLQMELDTGTFVSLMSEKTWREFFPESELVGSDVLLKTYSGEKLHVLGQMQAQIEYNEQTACLPLLVVAGDGPTLWGRNCLTKIRLNWGIVKQVHNGVESLLHKYSDVFRNELGTLRDIKVKLVIPENTTPRFFKPRPVPYAICGAIERPRASGDFGSHTEGQV